MNLLNISFYILVGILVFSIIIALVWTQIIKPDTSEDKLNKLTSFPQIKLKTIIKKIAKKNSNVFYNLLIRDEEKNRRKNIYIPGIIVTDEKVYLLASPVFSDKKISLKKGKYIFYDKENIDLKYDKWFEKTKKFLSIKLEVSEDVFQMIIPTIKKTKNLKNFIKAKDLYSNPIFNKFSQNSKIINSRILSLNIINKSHRKV